jgi:phenylalanyl-tRNA synthetase alpha chain
MSFDGAHILEEARAQIEACTGKESLDALRIKYLGRKGVVQELMGRIPTLSVEERRSFGAGVNGLKKNLEALFIEKESGLAVSSAAPKDFVDITLPGKAPLSGKLHPLTQVEGEICGVFSRLGFQVFKGPEAETEFHNFEALNIPLDHPSRETSIVLSAAFYYRGRASRAAK